MAEVDVPLPATGPRVLGFGLHQAISVRAQANMRKLGLGADSIVVENTDASDQIFIEKLKSETWEAVIIGGGASAQSPEVERTPEGTAFFNRILNLIHQNVPQQTKIVLVTGPGDIANALHRELGWKGPNQA
jgi:hypothetical protein